MVLSSGQAAAVKPAAAAKSAKAAEDAAKREADAQKKAQDAIKAAQEAQLKKYSEAVTAMQLDIAQREIEGAKISLQELQAVNDQKIEIETYRRAQGLIGEQEYINNVRQLELEYAAEVKARKDEEDQKERELS